MVSDGPLPGEPDDEGRRHQPERHTEPIPSAGYGEVIDIDDVEYAAIDATQASVGYDNVDLIPTEKPSDLVRRYLFPTEKFRGEWRRHWIHLAKRLAIGVVATFVLGYLSGIFAKRGSEAALTVLVIVWIAIMAWVLWDVAEWYFDRFILTNKRVMLIEGIFRRDVAMMPLTRVTDMKYTQTALGRVLGYGTFEIESAGQEQALREVTNLPNPTDVYLQVVEEMYEPEAAEARRRPVRAEEGV